LMLEAADRGTWEGANVGSGGGSVAG